MRAIEAMLLTASTRLFGSSRRQNGRAKRDTVMASHDAAFEERAEEFAGAALLRHVVWSNEPDTESTSHIIPNKQCTGKDFVVPVAHLLFVELFLRYDSFEVIFSIPVAFGI
ncbi:allene oxide synthase 1, chloroplastic-like [Musa acuminata AAA Group]|uniref:allene oxide synthase 1, chloroplastic-like n=1 Tax=Musa acuminata AAA Group TaxID=214697 RepID=UPI0031E2F733